VLVTDRSPTAALDDLGWPWRTTRHLDVDRNRVADRTHDAAPAGEQRRCHAAMSGEQAQGRDTEPRECAHLVRVRDSYSGFASAETVCAACGDAFDADREQELRQRDHAGRVGMPPGETRGERVSG